MPAYRADGTCLATRTNRAFQSTQDCGRTAFLSSLSCLPDLDRGRRTCSISSLQLHLLSVSSSSHLPYYQSSMAPAAPLQIWSHLLLVSAESHLPGLANDGRACLICQTFVPSYFIESLGRAFHSCNDDCRSCPRYVLYRTCPVPDTKSYLPSTTFLVIPSRITTSRWLLSNRNQA